MGKEEELEAGVPGALLGQEEEEAAVVAADLPLAAAEAVPEVRVERAAMAAKVEQAGKVVPAVPVPGLSKSLRMEKCSLPGV